MANKQNTYITDIENRKSEIKLLLACSLTYLSSEKIEIIKNFINKNINWDYLINFARVNKMIPILYWHLSSICPEDIPQEYFNCLKNHFYASSKSNLYLTMELFKILNLFKKHGIEAVPYKGPILTSYLYKNLALREFCDLDILIYMRDALKVKELLSQEGYALEQNISSDKEISYLNYGYEHEYIRETDGVLLEVHWRIAPVYFSRSIDLKYLSSQLTQTNLGKDIVPTLSHEDLILVLCVQGAKDSWETLSSIRDVTELINLKSDINWDYILKTACQFNCKRMILLGLFLAYDLLGANIPMDILQKIKNDKSLKKLASQVYKRIFNTIIDVPLFEDIRCFQLKVRENLKTKIHYLISFAFTPTPEDWCFIKIPKALSFIYYLTRPIRLIAKYAFRHYGGQLLSEFVPTPVEVVRTMLEMANVKSQDILYDIGCGKGHIIITAAKLFGIRCVGIEVNPCLIEEAKTNARKEGVEHLITFIEKDAMETDLQEATILTFFLTETLPVKFKAKLEQELKNSSRIISNNSSIDYWTPDVTKSIPDEAGFVHTVRLWYVGKQLQNNSIHIQSEKELAIK